MGPAGADQNRSFAVGARWGAFYVHADATVWAAKRHLGQRVD